MKRGWLLACAILAAAPARAADTQYWISDGAEDYAKSEARGVSVLPDGSLALGPEVVEAKNDSASIYWAAAALGDGSVALGSAHEGRIDRWIAGQGIRPWVRLGAGQVLCLARDGGDLLAGTGPDGLVYRISARGDTALAARSGERYVWALARGAKGWYAATGTRGRVLAIEGVRVGTVFDSDETNVVSLVSDGAGGVYAGGDSQGRIVRVRADGSVTTVFDASENEVRGLALGPAGVLYAAALTAPAVPEEDRSDEPRPTKSSTGRAVVYRIVPDSVVAQHWVSPQPFVFAVAVRGGEQSHLLVATGNRSGLYRVDERGEGALVLAPGAGQLTAIALDAAGNAYVAGSNPATLFRVSAEPAPRGTLTSAPLDARRYARFGRIRWRGDARGGAVRLRTRSGNSEPPDSTWSRWSGQAGQESFRVASPAARYVQWEIELARGGGAGPRVESVEVAYREQNLAPHIEDLTVAPQGAGFREGELTPRTDPVTQTLPSGQRVEFQLRTGEARGLRSLPQWLRGLRVIQWRASDPNGDQLRFRLDYRAEGESGWREIGKHLKEPSYVWDTNGLPDGRYRVRLTASDATSVEREEALEAVEESAPLTVDNTPPVVVDLTATAGVGEVRVRGRARDEKSILTDLEIAVDSGDWRPLHPDGGLADDQELSFSTVLRELTAGDHSVSVRAVDAAGNSATRATPVRVTRR